MFVKTGRNSFLSYELSNITVECQVFVCKIKEKVYDINMDCIREKGVMEIDVESRANI